MNRPCHTIPCLPLVASPTLVSGVPQSAVGLRRRPLLHSPAQGKRRRVKIFQQILLSLFMRRRSTFKFNKFLLKLLVLFLFYKLFIKRKVALKNIHYNCGIFLNVIFSIFFIIFFCKKTVKRLAHQTNIKMKHDLKS